MTDVFISSEENRTAFKKAIIDYLNGKNDINVSKNNIRLACTYRMVSIDAKTFCRNIPLSKNATDSDLDPQIIDILEHLNLPIDKSKYTELTSLYDLLRLQKGMEYLCDELIDTSRPILPWINYLTRPMVLTLGVLGYCYMHPKFFWSTIDWIIDTVPILYQWLYHYIIQLHNLPLFGMAGQAVLMLYYLRKTFEHGLDPSVEKVRALTFRSAAIGLNFLAHLISYAVSGALPLLPAAIFITSSFLDVVESFYTYWIQRPIQLKPTYESPHEKAFDYRHNHAVERNRQVFLIRILYAISITSLVVIWSSLPPSVILTMAYMLSMWLAFLIKDYCTASINHSQASALQMSIFGIYNAPEFTAEQLVDKAKTRFTKYARQELQKIHDNDKQAKCFQHMEQLLSTIPFKYLEIKNKFDLFIEFYDVISPTKQQPHHYGTPARFQAVDAANEDSDSMTASYIGSMNGQR
ncbi:MAG: hypothetical protein CK424_04525 [Legionella sp.]|nr:MAG: hypothetical protein CK424_04525 [Legionella sp.]